jgi:hypothetical protein
VAGCGCSGSCVCTKKDGFTVPDPATLRCSLARRLIPAVDRVRDLYTQIGARPYRVWIIKTRFTGERRGRGVEQVIHETEILPTPLVVDLRALSEVVTPVGVNDQGVIQLQYISGRYTEELLLGVGLDGHPVAPNETVYYEIEFFRADGLPSERRRFVRDSVPHYNALQFQWLVTLVSAIENRARDRTPEG